MRDMGWSLVLCPGARQREVKEVMDIQVVLVDTEILHSKGHL